MIDDTPDIAMKMQRLIAAFFPLEIAARKVVRVIDITTPEYIELKAAIENLDRVMASVSEA